MAQILRFFAGEGLRPEGERYQQAATGSVAYTVRRRGDDEEELPSGEDEARRGDPGAGAAALRVPDEAEARNGAQEEHAQGAAPDASGR